MTRNGGCALPFARPEKTSGARRGKARNRFPLFFRIATLGSFLDGFSGPKLRAAAFSGPLRVAASLLLHNYASANPLRLPRLSQTRTSWGSLLRAPLQGRGKARRRTRSQGESRSRSTTSPGARDLCATGIRRQVADTATTLHPATSLLSGMLEAGEARRGHGCGSHRSSSGMREASLR